MKIYNRYGLKSRSKQRRIFAVCLSLCVAISPVSCQENKSSILRIENGKALIDTNMLEKYFKDIPRSQLFIIEQDTPGFRQLALQANAMERPWELLSHVVQDVGDVPIHLGLVRVQSKDHWRRLASALHDHTHQGASALQCGRIVSLDAFQGRSESWLTQSPSEAMLDAQILWHSPFFKQDWLPEILEPSFSDNLRSDIESMANLGHRDALEIGARDASDTIYAMFETIAASDNSGRISLHKVEHDDTEQFSIVTRIAATSDRESKSTEKVIIGAHLDSINSSGTGKTNAPGADDNASGIASLLQILRFIVDADIKFHRTVELHAYAFEEYGLIGSGAIAEEMRRDGQPISAMMQIDMNAYSSDGNAVPTFITKDTDPSLTAQMQNLYALYIGEDYNADTISGGTSDHKVFFQRQYPTLFVFENPKAYNTAIHTANDTLENLNDFTLAEKITRLAAVFAIHAGGGHLDEKKPSFSSADSSRKALGEEIFIALDAIGDSYQLYASVPVDTETAYACDSQATYMGSCQMAKEIMPLVLIEAPNIKARKIFVSPSLMTLTAGKSYMIIAQGAGKNALAHRAFSVK